MNWNEQICDSWSSFQDFCEKCARVSTPVAVPFICRGVSDERFNLCPSLARITAKLSLTQAIKIETLCLREFQAAAHLYLVQNHCPSDDDDIEWFQIMQHFGACTRLLDWTTSLYVAAYFAVETNTDRNGAIWMVKMREFKAAMNKRFGMFDLTCDPRLTAFRQQTDKTRIIAIPLSKHNPRSLSQQGVFTLCQDPRRDQAPLIAETLAQYESNTTSHTKIIIPSQLKAEFKRRLWILNVRALTLFPGLEGLGRAARESAGVMSESTEELGILDVTREDA